LFVDVKPIAYDKEILYIEANVFGLEFHFTTGFLIQKTTNPEGLWSLGPELIGQELQCPAAIYDILDDDHIPALYGDSALLGNPNGAR